MLQRERDVVRREVSAQRLVGRLLGEQLRPLRLGETVLGAEEKNPVVSQECRTHPRQPVRPSIGHPGRVQLVDVRLEVALHPRVLPQQPLPGSKVGTGPLHLAKGRAAVRQQKPPAVGVEREGVEHVSRRPPHEHLVEPGLVGDARGVRLEPHRAGVRGYPPDRRPGHQPFRVDGTDLSSAGLGQFGRDPVVGLGAEPGVAPAAQRAVRRGLRHQAGRVSTILPKTSPPASRRNPSVASSRGRTLSMTGRTPVDSQQPQQPLQLVAGAHRGSHDALLQEEDPA